MELSPLPRKLGGGPNKLSPQVIWTSSVESFGLTLTVLHVFVILAVGGHCVTAFDIPRKLIVKTERDL